MYMEKSLYKNIVYGILSWHKFAGTPVVYRTDLSQQFFVMGVITVNHRSEVIGSELSTYMEEFAKEHGGHFIRETDSNGNVVKGSVRVEF
jgi:hypothetical protein